MKDFIKAWLDKLSPPPKAPAPEVQEAEQMNVEFDSGKKDEAVRELRNTNMYFSEVVRDVVAGVRQDRHERRSRGQKVH